MSKARARRIKLLIFDVDGVLTDGTIYLFPAPGNTRHRARALRAQHPGGAGFGIVSHSMVEAKGFHAHDGTAISLARLAGLKTGIITKRISETVALRARDLAVDHVHQGVEDKASILKKIVREEKISEAEVAYVGDDIIDLPIMRRCGLAIAVANARDEVKKEAQFITRHGGGQGAARDAVEYILRAQGKWNGVMRRYLAERSGEARDA